MIYYHEKLYKKEYGQFFKIDKILYKVNTRYQHLLIFENSIMGRVLALDGIIQTTEADEFIYHEMMAHIPIISHGNPKQVLIIGGGDGGLLREIVKHAVIEKIFLVEIDNLVIDACKKWLPNHSNGAFNDKRLTLIIDDGINFMINNKNKYKFDIIISDSSDPLGPNQVLFTKQFYQVCKKSLTNNGILVTQNGTNFLQINEIKKTTINVKNMLKN